jgi:hypothetical protein
MMPDLLLVMVLGFVFLSVFGIVLARRMAMAAFSLFALNGGFGFGLCHSKSLNGICCAIDFICRRSHGFDSVRPFFIWRSTYGQSLG